MGYAKYYEDIEEQIVDSRFNYELHKEMSWEAEQKRIGRFISNVPDIKKRSRREAEAQIKSLYKIREALQFRSNLSRTLDGLSTPLARMLVENYRMMLSRASSQISKLISEAPISLSKVQCELSKKEKIDEKSNLIYQMVSKFIIAINNFSQIDTKSIQSLLEDIKLVIAWEMNSDCLLCSLKNVSSEGIDISWFLKNEMDYDLITCNICHKKTIANCKCCLQCGSAN